MTYTLKNIKLFIVYVTSCLAFNAHADAQHIAIGLLADLTGTGASNGQACREGYEVARRAFAPEDRVGNSAISFLYGDHKGEAKTGLSEVARVIEQGAIAVVSNRGNVGMAIGPQTQRRGIPLLGIMGHAEFTRTTSSGFRFWPSPEEEGAELARYARKAGKSRAALLVLEDDYILAVAKSFEKEFTNKGGMIAFRENILDGESDWSATLTRIRALRPDILFLNASVSKLGTLIRRARELGLEQSIISNFWLSYPEVLATAGANNLEGSTFVGIDIRQPRFQYSYTQEFPEGTPSAVTYACYSALASLLRILNDSSVRDPQQLLARLNSAQKFELLDGSLQIIDREAKFKLMEAQYQGGTIVASEGGDNKDVDFTR